jgi:threonine dehydratase
MITKKENLSKILSGQEIVKAYNDIQSVCIKTEVRRLDWLKRISGINVFGKFENQQKTGSFKFRGAYNRLRNQDPKRPVIAASAGNHGLAVADAASMLNINTTICIPTSASSIKKNRLLAYNHSIVQQGASLEEATEYAKKLALEHNSDFISPFNDALIIQGQGTVAVEFLKQIPSLDTLIIPVGGGGLICGMAIVAKYLKPSIKIIGVEPERYASFSSSLKSGKIKKVINYPTVADGLAVNLEKDSITYDIGKKIVDQMVSVSEEEIYASVLALLYHESQLVEPSGAVGLAAIISGKIDSSKLGNIGLIFSGGNISTTNLSRIINYPFQEKKLFDFINILGTKLAYQNSPKGVDFSASKNIKINKYSTNDQKQEVKEDVQYWEDRFNDIKRIINNIEEHLSEYIKYCKVEKLNPDKSAVELIQEFIKTSKKNLQDKLPELSAKLDIKKYNNLITQNLQKYRALLHSIMSASMVLDWRSASYNQSLDTMFFGLDTQRNPGVNYNRYESNQLTFVEKMLAKVLGLNQEKTMLLATSSGMAAYNLIESYLIRYVLKPNDIILIPHYIYFETDEQISKIFSLNIVRADTHDTEEIIKLIAKNKPRIVFLDQLTNTVELRITDVETIIRKVAENKTTEDIYFIIDGSMISGEINPSTISDNPHIKILYYDSCSKYLQLGLDIGMGGLIVAPTELSPTFERLRRNIGAIMYDSVANIFPIYSHETHKKRMRRFTRNAVIIGEKFNNDVELSKYINIHFPLLKNHPDYKTATNFDSLGGLITFSFKDQNLNQRESLNSLIEIVLIVAKEHGVSLTKGVSFGFSIPRISAASAMAENTPPFLRLSTGDRSFGETNLLGDALVEAFKRYIKLSKNI